MALQGIGASSESMWHGEHAVQVRRKLKCGRMNIGELPLPILVTSFLSDQARKATRRASRLPLVGLAA